MILKTLSSRSLGAMASTTGVMSICLLTLPYHLFPQFYIPKENAAMGYTVPASAEGWAFLVIGILLLIATVVLISWLKTKQIWQIRFRLILI
jgi:hypothetical protein